MTVDWLTVGAQALNFLVLVYLLKRFLYGPIVRAVARRRLMFFAPFSPRYRRNFTGSRRIARIVDRTIAS